jgi:hypothetical protein
LAMRQRRQRCLHLLEQNGWWPGREKEIPWSKATALGTDVTDGKRDNAIRESMAQKGSQILVSGFYENGRYISVTNALLDRKQKIPTHPP